MTVLMQTLRNNALTALTWVKHCEVRSVHAPLEVSTNLLQYWPIDTYSVFFCKKMDYVDYPAWTALACKGFVIYVMKTAKANP